MAVGDLPPEAPGEGTSNSAPLGDVEALIDELVVYQRRKRRALADRLKGNITDDDLDQPHDIPELGGSPLFQYEDGVLAGIESVKMAIRARYRR
jgi:hypothetical protein